MNISFLGTGNCATVVARLCKEKGHVIRQVIGRNLSAARALAEELNCGFAGIHESPDTNIDLLIIAISDHALTHAVERLHFGNTPVVHTAGSVSIDILKKVSENFGVLYPLQSLNKELDKIPDTPFIIEASNAAMLEFLQKFASSVSAHVEEMDSEKRLRLHTAAVIVNNFTNYLYSVAEAFCIEEQVDFNLLYPLILETAERIQTHSAADLQTGPAVRKDIATLDKHLKLLNAHPKLRTMYLRLTEGIMNA